MLQELELSAAELKFLACVAGQDHVTGLKNYGYAKGTQLIEKMSAATRADVSLMLDSIATSDEGILCCAESKRLLKLYEDASIECGEDPEPVAPIDDDIYLSEALRFVCEEASPAEADADGVATEADYAGENGPIRLGSLGQGVTLRRPKLFSKLRKNGFNFERAAVPPERRRPKATGEQGGDGEDAEQPAKSLSHEEYTEKQRCRRMWVASKRGGKAIPLPNLMDFSENTFDVLDNGMQNCSSSELPLVASVHTTRRPCCGEYSG